MSYHRSRHAVVLLNYHFMFVPNYRKKFLVGNIRERLLELFNEYAEKFKTHILAVEVMPDHVHLFLSGKPHVAPSQIALYLKGWPSNVLREAFPWLSTTRPSGLPRMLSVLVALSLLK